MKTAKKSLALLLALLMCLSLFSTMAFAEDAKTEYTLVCIGDSTSQGYFLEDYVDEDSGAYDNSSKDSYPFLLQQYIQNKLGDSYDVKLRNMTFTGMRTDELRGILDPSFLEIAKAKNGGNGDKFFTDHYSGMNEYFYDDTPDPLTLARFAEDRPDVSGCTTIYNMLKLKGYVDYDVKDVTDKNAANVAFTESIKKADCITLDTTMNNFGTYLCSRLMAIVGMGDKSEYSESIEELGPGLDIDVAKVEAKAKELIAQYLPEDLGLPEGMVDGLLDMFVYCYCDFRVNFEENIRLIRELNPDAKLLVFGAYNGMDGLICDIGGMEVNFGKLWGAYMGLVNTFITTTCKYNDQYVYVDCTPGVRVFTGALAQDDAYPRYMDCMINVDKGEMPSAKEIATQVVGGVQAAMEGVQKLTNVPDLQAMFGLEGALPPFTEDAYYAYAAVCEGLVDNIDMITPMAPSMGLTQDDIDNLLYGISLLPCYSRAYQLVAGTDEGVNMITERLIESAKFAPLDFMGIFAAMGGGIDAIMVNAMFKEEPTATELSVLHIYARFLSARGIGTHPDDVGCAQKAEYVCQAFEKNYSAKYDGQSAIVDLGKNVASAAWTTLKTPVLDALKDAFNKFASTIQNILNTIFQPVFSIFDKIPSC